MSGNVEAIANAATHSQFMVNSAATYNSAIPPQFVGQTMASMPMNYPMSSMATPYPPYGNPAMLQYGSASQLPQYQQMLPSPMDIASMFALSFNQTGMPMQPFSYPPQQNNSIPMRNPLLGPSPTLSSNTQQSNSSGQQDNVKSGQEPKSK